MKDHFDLVIDVGNSRTKLALFKNGRLDRVAAVETVTARGSETFLYGVTPAHVVIGSVGKADPELLALLGSIAPVLEVTGLTPTPLGNAYATPASLGADRIANAVGAYTMFPGRNVLVIDAGTCITYDLVGADGTYAGGAISPGVRLRALAMHEHSARLPLVEARTAPPLMGTSTIGSLASGVYHGTLAELRGMIDAFRHHGPEMAVILTGGDSLEWVRALKSGIFAHPLLTLVGLHAILVHNRDPHGIAGSSDPARGKGAGATG